MKFKKTMKFCTLLCASTISLSICAAVHQSDNEIVYRPYSPNEIDLERELEISDSIIISLTINNEDVEVILAEEGENGSILEIYDEQWDNDMVHPYKNIKVPDSVLIDCSKFAFPTFGHITSHFGPRRRRMHNGIDLKVYKGDSIAAAFNGKVRVAKYMRGYGNVVVLRHSNGLETIYGHLSKILVKIDQEIEVGECIGLGGSTGRSTGTHLHFETRLLGRPINPSEIFDFESNTLKTDKYTFYAARSPYRDTRSANMAYHRVKSGETLGMISTKYKISVAELCRLNRLKSTSTLRIGQVIRLENTYTASKKTPRTKEQLAQSVARASAQQKEEERQSTQKITNSVTASTHKVRSGETLSKIAKKYGLTTNQLCRLNNLTETSKIRPNQSLRIRGAESTPKAITKQLTTNPMQQTAQIIKNSSVSKGTFHEVRQGDTLHKIASAYGVTIETLCSLNNIRRETTLRLGQKLRCS